MRKIFLFFFPLFFFSAHAQQVVECDYAIRTENAAVRKFLQEVEYEPHEESMVSKYIEGVYYRRDWPAALSMTLPHTDAETLDIVCTDMSREDEKLTFRVPLKEHHVKLYNFVPGRIYQYEVRNGETLVQKGKIYSVGQLRMLNIEGEKVYNIRDMGGWKTVDGRSIKYGKMIRGCELNGTRIASEEGISTLLQLGVEAELDLRANYNEGHNVSAFAFTDQNHTPAGEMPSYYYSSDSGQLPAHMNDYGHLYRWRKEFEFIIRSLEEGRTIYAHCVNGKDRMGFLAFLLEGLLGISYSDIVKDYELSFFAYGGGVSKESIDAAFDIISQMDGDTLRDRFETFFRRKIFVSQSDIDYFRSEMLEGGETDTAIGDVQPKTDAERACYDMAGQRVETMRKGKMYVVRVGNGTRKVFCR